MDNENANKVEETKSEQREEPQVGKIISTQTFPVQKCKTEFVTVYNDRAEVTRRLEASFGEKGTHEVVLEGISHLVDKNSVRVSGGRGHATVLEVSVTSKWTSTKTTDDTSRSQQLVTKQKEFEKQIARLNEAMTRVTKEANWLNEWSNNALHPKTGKKDDVSFPDVLSAERLKEVSNFMDFYEEHLAKIDSKKAGINAEIEELNKGLQDIRSEISHLNAPRSSEIRVVIVTLYVQEKTDVSLELSYLITGASWTPSYDCRVNSSNNTLQLVYYGSISNSTGENWSDVQVTLSTAQPSAGGSPPKLPTARVQFYVPQPIATSSYFEANDMLNVQSVSFARSMAPAPSSAPRKPSSAAPPVNVLTAQASQGSTSTTFSIPRQVTIDSDNKPHKVTITVVEDLKPRFTYSVIPSKTTLAYLKVSVQNTTSDFPFLAGPIGIFMDANYVTSSTMKTVSPGEEFALFLGVDQSIKVDYKPVKKLTEGGGLLSKNKVQHVQCLTEIKNTKKIDVAVVMYEQLPLSSDGKIKVTALEPNLEKPKGDIKLNSHNNIEWRYTIAAGTKFQIPFNYDIEWPKDKDIEVNED